MSTMYYFFPTMKQKLPYKALLFDIGGVLVELTGVPRMMELTGHRLSIPQLWEKWITSPVIRAFESGKMSIEEFGPAIIDEFDIDLPAEQYLAEFTTWPSDCFEGADKLLSSLKQDFTLASLSNTNVLHWNRVMNEMNIIHHFTWNFPSHETGKLKPDRDTFVFVADTMKIAPGDILFLDDNRINVEGALSAGMNAAEVHGVEGVKSFLQL